MDIKIILLVLTMTPNFLYGQKEDIEFGNISLADLKMPHYYKDTAASAIILFNKGSVKVDGNSNVGTVFIRHIRIKIFKKSALNEWANMNFIVEKNEVSKLVAATYNLTHGRVEKSEIPNAQIYKKQFTKGVQQISFAFPNVREGSIIELAFTLKYEGTYLPSWQFQYPIPVVRSEYILQGTSKLTPHLRGSLSPTDHIVKHSGTYHEWHMDEIPAFKYEPLMPDKNAYISSIEFVSSATWENIYSYLITHQSLGEIISGHKYLNKKVEEITAGIGDSEQKIKAVSNFIKRTVTWNGICDYLADSPQDVLEKKTGTSGDINLLFASMLKKAGLNVAIVLLSTRDHGFIQQGYPSHSQFNYVICQVTLGDKELLLDATEKFLPFDILPGRCFNHKAFLVSTEQYGWIGIEPIKRDRILLTSNLKLTEDGALTGETTSLRDGYAAFNSRKSYRDDEGEESLRNICSSHHLEVKKIEVLNLRELEKPLTERYEIKLEGYASLADNVMYVNPYVFLREQSNPFTLEAREYPIDFDMIVEKVNICNIAIPENYLVEEIPKSKTLTLPENAGKCTLSVTQNGNIILVVSRLQINKTLFMQNEYLNLKEFYARIVSKMSEVIVLKKKL